MEWFALPYRFLTGENAFFATLSIHAPNTRMSLEEMSLNVPLLRVASRDLTLITDPGDN